QVFKNILVCLNLYEGDALRSRQLALPARKAVEVAFWLGQELSAELTFFSVLGNSGWGFGPSSSARAAEAEQILSGLVQQARQSNVPARALLAEGTAWSEIVKSAQDKHHDLVLLGKPVTSGLTYALFG